MEKIHVEVLLILAIIGVVSTVSVYSLLMANQRFTNNGVVNAIGVGVYWDYECTENVTNIDWNLLDPGETVNRTVYVKNSGEIPIVLGISTDEWIPASASTYITLSWNCTGYMLTPGSVIPAALSLSVLPDISGITNFSFDITIEGVEYA